MSNKLSSLILSSVFLATITLASCSFFPQSDVENSENFSFDNSNQNTTSSTEYQVSDLTLENNLNNTIESIYPSTVYNHNLYAIVWKGKTLLLGEAKNEKTKKDIFTLAAKVYGIKTIIDGTEVNSKFKAGILQSTLDSTITSTIKAAFLLTKTIDSLKIKVITQNQIVYLLCNTNEEQAKLASTIARSIKDVKEVKYLIP